MRDTVPHHIWPAEGHGLGSLLMGPLRQTTAKAFKACLGRHHLSTGHDQALRLQNSAGASWVTASGAAVTGYLLESGSFGLEACEEAIDDFLLEVCEPDRLLRICGHYAPEPNVQIRSSANYLLAAGGVSRQVQRSLQTGGQSRSLLALGGPLLLPPVQMAAVPLPPGMAAAAQDALSQGQRLAALQP